uniref:Uncharacterized protein n=1 Tax=Anguilla anguilla TaxID=7936 RepID=A0A0E9VPF6_ANGAN
MNFLRTTSAFLIAQFKKWVLYTDETPLNLLVQFVLEFE